MGLYKKWPPVLILFDCDCCAVAPFFGAVQRDCDFKT
jgi:hypothetical protein